jgi:ABC-2 type transport system ATP-binding protein
VLSDIRPDETFKQVEAGLEDVYFSRIAEKLDIVTV